MGWSGWVGEWWGEHKKKKVVHRSNRQENFGPKTQKYQMQGKTKSIGEERKARCYQQIQSPICLSHSVPSHSFSSVFWLYPSYPTRHLGCGSNNPNSLLDLKSDKVFFSIRKTSQSSHVNALLLVSGKKRNKSLIGLGISLHPFSEQRQTKTQASNSNTFKEREVSLLYLGKRDARSVSTTTTARVNKGRVKSRLSFSQLHYIPTWTCQSFEMGKEKWEVREEMATEGTRRQAGLVGWLDEEKKKCKESRSLMLYHGCTTLSKRKKKKDNERPNRGQRTEWWDEQCSASSTLHSILLFLLLVPHPNLLSPRSLPER